MVIFQQMTAKHPEEGTYFSNSHKGVLCVVEFLFRSFLASMPRSPSTSLVVPLPGNVKSLLIRLSKTKIDIHGLMKFFCVCIIYVFRRLTKII